MSKKKWHMQWLSTNIRADVLSGMTVALALIPEAIAFSIIAGVDPMVGLYASFCIVVVISLVGGRPAMISAATGAMALLMVDLVKDHGLQYLFAATVLTGVLQYLLGLARVGRFISNFIPHSVMIGFVNALAILIFMAQLPHFYGASWVMYVMVAATLAIVYLLPRWTTVVPAPLVAIILMTVISMSLGLDLKTVGDMGEIKRALPEFVLPDIPFAFDTFRIIFPTSFALALVGILESLLTAKLLDELTDTDSDKNKEIRGQGLANVVSGFFGGMAGCAMIGQSMINVKSGGRGRLSTLVAGVFLLFLIMVLGDWVKQIPMGALVGVMIMVSISTFDWQSLAELRKMPVGDALVMIATVAVVVATHDLSKGVMVGVVLSSIRFGWKMSRIQVSAAERGNAKIYTVSGPLFFASTSHFIEQFDFQVSKQDIIIDFTHSHVWDHSGVTAIAKVVDKYQRGNKRVTVNGLNEESRALVNRVGLTAPTAH